MMIATIDAQKYLDFKATHVQVVVLLNACLRGAGLERYSRSQHVSLAFPTTTTTTTCHQIVMVANAGFKCLVITSVKYLQPPPDDHQLQQIVGKLSGNIR